MPRCPITYEEIALGSQYSKKGLSILSPRLTELLPFPYTAEEQLQLASQLASKLSIQGVQPKLSVAMDVKHNTFKVVERGGHYILKPQNPLLAHLPENEDLTMKLAALAGLEVPVHGLAYAKDGKLFYFIQRFDRKKKGAKVAVEDFTQLAGLSRETKYNSSVEKVVSLLETYMTFPAIEKAKFFRLFLFNFLTGNEDAHLKNYSVITIDGKHQLSPCYDLVNSTLALNGKAAEESALPLAGKKNHLGKKEIFQYLARERLHLTEKTIDSITQKFESAVPLWKEVIQKSFLPDGLKELYWDILSQRIARIFV